MKILFVDDEKGLQDQIKIYLERLDEDIEVLTTSSVDRALDMIDENDFDVIVSDHKMPGKDGLEFLKEIRKTREEDIPFIIFTGKGNEEIALEALNLGADRYIQKSIDPESQYELLLEAIEDGYEHGRSKKRLKESEEKLKKSRKKYQKIFYDSPIGAFHYDDEGIITECNDKSVEIVGSSRDAVTGLDMLDDLDNSKLIEEVRSSLEDGEGFYEGEYTSVTGDKTIDVKVFLRGIEDEDGQIDSGIGLVEDNTERKEYERELRRKERYLARTPNYITVIDEEGEIKYHSYPSDEITGLDPSKIMGAEALEFVHPDDREKAAEMFSKVVENPGEDYRTELRGEVEEGWIWLEIRSVNYLDDPEINGIIITAQDISKRKDMEKELRGSEQKFGTIIEGSADAIFLTDHEGNYTYENKGASDLLGYSREEITEMNIVDISPVGKLEEYQKTFQKIVEEEKIHTEITIIDKEGKTIPVDLNAVLLPNGMVYGSIRDISDRKEAEEKLMEQEKKYRSIFEQFQDLYYRTDAEGFIQELSPSVKDLSGYDRDELIGEYVGKVYPNPEEREGLLNELSENGEVRGYEMKLEKKSGEKAVVSVNSHIIMDEDGEVEGVEGTIRDITERKEAQERQNFLHSLLRHDMANKAQAVQGYLQLLEEDETLSEDSKKMVNGTLKANKESINLIQKVRLLLSAQKEEKKSVRIVPIIKGAVESNKPIAEKVGMDISVQCPSLDCEVEGGSLLDEVFYNIIENSIKHSGGSKIQISGEITEEEVVCTIEDDGVGIPDDKKEIIFEKGYTTDEERGTGLGMFIVNILLESYGGSIEVKDSKLGGARFDVKLKRSD